MDDTGTDRCTYTLVWADIPLGECAQPATSRIRTACPHGHVETAPVCATHLEAATAGDALARCAACADGGSPRVPATCEEVRHG